METVKEWLKKWWMWLVAGVAALVAIVIGRKLLSKEVVVQPGPSKAQLEEEKKAEAAKELATTKHEAEVKAVESNHKKEVNTTVEHIEDVTAVVISDPQKTNDFLHSVSSIMHED